MSVQSLEPPPFKALVIDYIDQRYGNGAKAPETVGAE
jgi:hypothetical protein